MSTTDKLDNKVDPDLRITDSLDFQECPVCGLSIGVVSGSHDATCSNCGFKDPCCE